MEKIYIKAPAYKMEAIKEVVSQTLKDLFEEIKKKTGATNLRTVFFYQDDRTVQGVIKTNVKRQDDDYIEANFTFSKSLAPALVVNYN